MTDYGLMAEQALGFAEGCTWDIPLVRSDCSAGSVEKKKISVITVTVSAVSKTLTHVRCIPRRSVTVSPAIIPFPYTVF